MQTNCYLVISDTGAIRTIKRRPALAWNEIAIELLVTLPDTLFQRPQLRAKVDLGELASVDIDAEVIDNIEAAILQTAGVEVRLEVVPHGED